MADVVLNINMDAKCVECRKGGATPSGVCLRCCTKAMDPKAQMKTPQGRALQRRYVDQFAALRKRPSGDN
jgi:hypothetical protein